MSALSDYLSEVARERGISGPRPFARHAGVPITTAKRLLDGTAEPGADTLETVAGKLGLSLDRLFRLAGIKEADPPFVLPPEFAALGPEQRRIIVTLGREFLRLINAQTPTRTQATVTPIGRARVSEASWDEDPPNGADGP